MRRDVAIGVSVGNGPNTVVLVRRQEPMLETPQLETLNERSVQQAQNRPVKLVKASNVHSSQELFYRSRHWPRTPWILFAGRLRTCEKRRCLVSFAVTSILLHANEGLGELK
jgi:hypothetical protein